MNGTRNFLPACVRRWKTKLVTGLALSLLAFGAVPAARADHIDESLISASKDLAHALQEKGFKNVGVLKFLVKKGRGPSDGNAGALNLAMAERIEWALIHGMDDAKPLGVIDNATHVAARSMPKFSVRSMQSRKAIFNHKYPLKWGNEKVTPDVFLTGTVDLTPDMKHATVDIGYFDKSGAIHQLKTLKVKTDRSILADSGQSFAISKRTLKKKRDLSELDDSAADSASKADQGDSVNQQLSSDSDSAPIKFEIMVNGMPAQKSPDSSSPGEFRIDSPPAGAKVTFQMTNTTQDKIAIVVKVNGLNTIEKEDSEDQACTKWILEPGKLYGLKGYYSGGKVDLFQVLNDTDSAARVSDEAFKGRGGWIDVTVFTQGGTADETAKTTTRSLRGLTQHGGKAQKPQSLHQARSMVNDHFHKSVAVAKSGKRKGRGLLTEGGGTQDQTLETDEFPNPTPSYNMHINYYTGSTPQQ